MTKTLSLFVGRSQILQSVIIALLFAPAVACAHVSPPQVPEVARSCPPGTFDYGDGMVAASLPKPVEQALWQARSLALTAAGSDVSPFLAEVPWRAHVSVIYGVTEAKITPALRALQSFVAHEHGTAMRFGALNYWDDPRGNKTTLVLAVEEPQDVLGQLHDALAQGARIGSRFAYHPHVTLAYLSLGKRLAANQEAAIAAVVAPHQWVGTSFYITDPCGQTQATAALQTH